MEFGAILSNLFVSMCWACGITFVVTLFREGLYVTLNKSKLLREARDAGHMIIAKLVKVKHEHGVNSKYIWGYYEYQYRNKTYKYKNSFLNYPPEEIILYFKDKPEKASTEEGFGGSETGYAPLFIVVTVIIFLIRL